jgi:hypothetical protein
MGGSDAVEHGGAVLACQRDAVGIAGRGVRRPLVLADLTDDLLLHILGTGWQHPIVAVKGTRVCKRWREAIRELVKGGFAAVHARADGYTIHRPTPYERCFRGERPGYFPLYQFLKEQRTVRCVETVDMESLMEEGGRHVSARMSLPRHDGDGGECHWFVVFQRCMVAATSGAVPHPVISATAYGTHGPLVKGVCVQFTVGVLSDSGFRTHFALDTCNMPNPPPGTFDNKAYRAVLYNASIFRVWGNNVGRYGWPLPPVWKDYTMEEILALSGMEEGKMRVELYICDCSR